MMAAKAISGITERQVREHWCLEEDLVAFTALAVSSTVISIPQSRKE